MADADQSQTVRFGLFEVDLRAGELRKNGIKIKLQQQPFQVLVTLLQHAGDVVTREELRRELWPIDTFVDFDHGLNAAIKRLRDALGESTGKPVFVETLARRGYRFIAPVDKRAAPPAAQPRNLLGRATHSLRQPSLFGLTGIAVAIVALAVALNSAGTHRWRIRAGGHYIESLAVLPLENLSHDPDQEYFADGMTDALITDLAKIRSLHVISHTSVLQYGGTRKPLPQIARELGVDAVVEGSVLRFRDRVQIRAQLVDAHADRHIWAESYERDLRDVIVVQNELAREIARQIRVELTPQEQSSLSAGVSSVPEAYDDYLRSRYFINNRRSIDGLRKSVEYSKRAIQVDPNYPLAYAGLAHSLISLSFNGGMRAKEAMPQAEAAAKQALKLDPSLSQAHVALGWIRMTYDWDWLGAETEIERALELDPNNPDAHRVNAHYLQAIGRTTEAIEEEKRSLQLDPFSVWANRNLGAALFVARRYDDAITQLQKVAEMDPHSAVLFKWIAWSYEAKGLEGEAPRFDLRDQVNNGLSPEDAKGLEETLAASGPERYWQALLQIKLRSPEKDAFELARIYAHLRRRQESFVWLKRACEERSVWMTLAKVDPTLDSLRSDPQFADVLRCINMVQ